ncbi:hypothetical protein JD276_09570 [Leucobacter sp. CSA1]|uniref:Uncharacterized protein n=1 Tax=Leucobacter chromiisoli TaxID=2796471 RepID=A0A934Q8X4_9MICO|nr:hypothetical protein [Leucobacter chromiisoli]MBK0419281.1 hypothetical protein [Leucobacter chromiisoli]
MTAGSGAAGMPRALRAARGTAGAAIATLFAAASHALVGGRVTALAVVATALLALPLCVALAGRTASLWRLAVAVACSQFVYHWSFAGLGLSTGADASAGGPGSGAPLPLHAEHLAGLESIAPRLADAAAADATMWVAHAVAAILTTLLLHRGERAALRLVGLIREALPAALPGGLPIPGERATLRGARFVAGADLRDRLCSPSAITHRGPPAVPVS